MNNIFPDKINYRYGYSGIRIILILVFSITFLGNNNGQVGSGPGPPELVLVTVDTATGNVVISWNHSPSSNVTYYAIEVMYLPGINEPTGLTLDSIPATDTFYVYKFAQAGYQSDGYRVYAIDNNSDHGISSRVDSTIYTSALFDSCSSSVTLKWNDYNSWSGEVYRIYQESDHGSPELIADVPEGTNELIIEDIEANTHYGFFVEAEHPGGLRSHSNKDTVITKMSRGPEYINARYATRGENNSVYISFLIDENSELDNYILMRSDSPLEGFDTIASLVPMNSEIYYTDSEANIEDGPFYYRLAAVNNCNQLSTASNIAGTILLEGEKTGDQINLSWNPYLEWANGVDEYRIFRRFGDDDHELIQTSLSTDFTDNGIEDLQYTELPSRVCYEIRAYEEYASQAGIQGSSTSNEICFDIRPKLLVPNAFTPDNDGVNDTFGPLLSYIPGDYLFQIFNRWGMKIFETRDPFEKWDGSINGKPAPEAVYVYFISINKGTKIEVQQQGHITVVYP